jgi:hypothetical protein
MHELSYRRWVLKMIFGALCASPWGTAIDRREPDGPPSLLLLFGKRFTDQTSVHAAAEAYLGQYPAESSPGKLCSLLLGGVGPCSVDSLSDRLHRCALREFSAGDVVIIGGWVLARCEARLLALASLVATGV